jgi:WD40 repeat protein
VFVQADGLSALEVDAAVTLDADPKGNWFVAFAPDGKTVATGGQDGILKLWDVPSGQQRRAGTASREPFRCAAFAPDGQTMVTGGSSGTLTVWDTKVARPLKSARNHSASIRTVGFTPDGKRVVASGQDRRLTVWDTATWRVVRSLPEQPQPILGSAISPDGKLLAIALGDPKDAESDGGVRLYDLDTLAERGELVGLAGGVWSVAFSPDGQTLATGRGRFLGLWDPITRHMRATTRVLPNIRVVAFAADGKTLVAVGSLPGLPQGQGEGAGQLLDVATLQPRATVPSHGRLIVGASFSPDGRLLGTASDSAPEVRLWDISRLPLPIVPAVADAPVQGPAMIGQLPAGGPAVAGSPPLPLRLTITTHMDDVWVAVFAPDGQTLATGGNDRIVRFCDAQTGNERQVWKSPGALRAAAYSPDGKWLAIGCANGIVQVWDVSQNRAIANLKKRPQSVRALAFAPDGKTLAVSGDDKTLVLHDTRTWDAIRSLAAQEEDPVLGVAYAPDGKTLALCTGRIPYGGAGSARLVDAASLEERMVLAVRHDVWEAAFSPDGKLLATIGHSPPDPVGLWDLATGTALSALKPALGGRRVVFTPDGRAVAVGQYDGTIVLFDPSTGRVLAASRGHTETIFGLAISPNGRLLATASGDATVKLWDVPAAITTGEKP